jgi:hypothetical protein
MTKYLRISLSIRKPFPSYITLQPLPSEFPSIWGQFSFLFYQCRHSWQKFFLQVSEARGRGQQEGEASAGSSDSSFRRYHFKCHTYLSLKFFPLQLKCSLQVTTGSTIFLADFLFVLQILTECTYVTSQHIRYGSSVLDLKDYCLVYNFYIRRSHPLS